MTPEEPVIPELEQMARRVAGDPVWFKRFGVQPWPAAYVTTDDLLKLTIAAPNVAATVNLSLRWQSPSGEIRPEFYTFTVGAPPSAALVKLLSPAEGFLISASVECPGTPRGQCFVTLELQRGQGTGDLTLGQLLIAGYPGLGFRIGYPQTPCQSPTDGRGAMRAFAVGNPAAGADWTTTVPANTQWILRSVYALLATDAVAPVREAALQIKDGGGVRLMLSNSIDTVAASTNSNISWFPASGAVTDARFNLGVIPPEYRLLPGWTISTSTLNLDAGDQWSNIRLTVEEFVQA